MIPKLKALYFKYKEQILYLFFGGCTTLVSLVTQFLLRPLGVTLYTAIAWVVSVSFAFVTNKLFVFESKTRDKDKLTFEVVSFFASRAGTLLVEWTIKLCMITWLHQNETLWIILSTVIVIVLNYFISKLIVFKRKK